MKITIHIGDCLDVLRRMPDESVGSVVTDPPYGLAFMGKVWDRAIPVSWIPQALRVLKPGGHLVAFGGSRTFHRLACAVEDAGFEIRDTLCWLYASGFPKSLNLAKAIPSATEWAGYGTALKPAWEPIILAMKPLVGTVAQNALQHGVGVLDIDAARIPIVGAVDPRRKKYNQPGSGNVGSGGVYEGGFSGECAGAAQPHPDSPRHDARGRWPANVVLSHDPRCEFRGTRKVKSSPGGSLLREKTSRGLPGGGFGQERAKDRKLTDLRKTGFAGADGMEDVEDWACVEDCPVRLLDDQSGERIASRFFFRAKASASERGPGNVHPTVKPVDLMRWLVRLVTPPGQVVLDPFFGSGSTGIACVREQRDCIGVELSPEYADIARRRIGAECPLFTAIARS